MAQTVPGIHIIVGSHTGVSLTYPPVIKDTVILHSPAKGMYFGQFELTFSNDQAGFYNSSTTRSLEKNLSNLRSRSNRKEVPKAEREQYQRTIGEHGTMRSNRLEGKNQFSNTIFPFTDQNQRGPSSIEVGGGL